MKHWKTFAIAVGALAGIPAAHAGPAFDNASFEVKPVVGWENVVPPKPVPGSARECTPPGTEKPGGSYLATAPVSIAPVPARPSLGGDYWEHDVAVRTPRPHGRCTLRLSKAFPSVRSPAFTPGKADRFASILVKATAATVSLVDDKNRTVLAGQRREYGGADRAVFDLARIPAERRRDLRFLIVRNAGDTLELDDARLDAERPATRGLASLYGVVDLHTHPFAQLGFGGRMFAGRIHSCIGRSGAECKLPSQIEQALGRCHDSHGQKDDGVTTIVPEMGHDAGGYPLFRGWPKYSTLSHQQMYVDWLKRAWQGGLRTFFMDVGHNPVMTMLFKKTSLLLPGDPTPNAWKTDEPQIAAQLQAARDFAALPDVRDWLEIAASAADLRRIVGAGKLAMVLGVEVDNFGGFNGSKAFWALTRQAATGSAGQRAAARTQLRQQLRAYLAKLHGLGVRHFFPIHVFDSVFGGAAVYDLKLEAGSYLFHRVFGAGDHVSQIRDVLGTGVGGAGIFARLDLEFEGIGKKARDLLTGARYAELFTRPEVGIPLLLAAAPLVVPLLCAIPIAGPLLALSLPVLMTTVHGIAKAVMTLEKELGLLNLLSMAQQQFVKAGHGRARHGFANARGLSPAGEILLEEAMRLGFLLDVSHMSDLATNDTLARAKAAKFPVMAGHTGFRETRFGSWRGELNEVGFFDRRTPNLSTDWREVPGDEKASLALWRTLRLGTGKPDSLANERSLSRTQVEEIRALGGLIGLGTGNGATPVRWGKVKPDCDGSSKFFAQEFLYAHEVTGGRGLALGTDANGFAGGFAPRFGTFACAPALDDPLRRALSPKQAAAQFNGVRYATQKEQPAVLPLMDRFLGPVTLQSLPPRPDEPWDLAGSLLGEIFHDARSETQKLLDAERAAWWGVAQFMAGQAPADRPFGCDTGHRGLERDAGRIAWGFRQAAEGKSRPPKHCGPLEGIGEGTDTNADGKAAWDVYKRSRKSSWWDAALTERIGRVYDAWYRMRGDNPPLVKSRAGTRDFDFNLDGLAHYGLLPDFLQDLRNVGVTTKQLSALFRGAEDLALMWEAVEGAAEALRARP